MWGYEIEVTMETGSEVRMSGGGYTSREEAVLIGRTAMREIKKALKEGETVTLRVFEEDADDGP